MYPILAQNHGSSIKWHSPSMIDSLQCPPQIYEEYLLQLCAGSLQIHPAGTEPIKSFRTITKITRIRPHSYNFTEAPHGRSEVVSRSDVDVKVEPTKQSKYEGDNSESSEFQTTTFATDIKHRNKELDGISQLTFGYSMVNEGRTFATFMVKRKIVGTSVGSISNL